MDKMNQMTSVRQAAKLTGLPYGWLRDQVLHGLNPPPTYVRPGLKRREVIPAEVFRWAKGMGIDGREINESA